MVQDLAVCNQGIRVELRTRLFLRRQPCPGTRCFASFSKELIPSAVHCFSGTDASQLDLGLRSHLQNVEAHSPSISWRKTNKISVLKSHPPFNSLATIWSLLFLFCG